MMRWIDALAGWGGGQWWACLLLLVASLVWLFLTGAAMAGMYDENDEDLLAMMVGPQIVAALAILVAMSLPAGSATVVIKYAFLLGHYPALLIVAGSIFEQIFSGQGSLYHHYQQKGWWVYLAVPLLAISTALACRQPDVSPYWLALNQHWPWAFLAATCLVPLPIWWMFSDTDGEDWPKPILALLTLAVPLILAHCLSDQPDGDAGEVAVKTPEGWHPIPPPGFDQRTEANIPSPAAAETVAPAPAIAETAASTPAAAATVAPTLTPAVAETAAPVPAPAAPAPAETLAIHGDRQRHALDGDAFAGWVVPKRSRWETMRYSYLGPPPLPEVQGSEEVIIDFIDEVLGDGKPVEPFTTVEGALRLVRKAGGPTDAALRGWLLPPNAGTPHFLRFTGDDDVLGARLVRRRAGVRCDLEQGGLDFSDLVILDFVLAGSPAGGWKIDDVEFIQDDYTIANTSWIYKVYWVWVLGMGGFASLGFVGLFRSQVPSQRERNAALNLAGRKGLFSDLVAWVLLLSWFTVLFPKAYASHLGFYWVLSFLCGLVGRNLRVDNVAFHAGRLWWQRFATWFLALVPLAVFFLIPEKYTPAQTSAMDLEVELTSRVEIPSGGVPLLSAAISDAPPVAIATGGEDLAFIAQVNAGQDTYYKVLSDQEGIVYVPIDHARLKRRTRHFERESDFLAVLVAHTTLPKPVDLPPEIASELGAHYQERGREAANRASVKDQFRALTLYDEALKYAPAEATIHLDRAFSLLELNRRLLRGNRLDLFALFGRSAVSYNKTAALSAAVIGYLERYVSGEAFREDREALVYYARLLAPQRAVQEEIRKRTFGGRFGTYLRLLVEQDGNQALALADELVRLDPRSALFLFHRGTALLGLGQTKDAARCFERAQALSPGSEMATLGLLASNIRQLTPEQVSAQVETALSQEPNFAHEAKFCAFLAEHGSTLAWFVLAAILVALVYHLSSSLERLTLGTLLRVYFQLVFFAIFCLFIALHYADTEPRTSTLVRALVTGTALPH